MLLENGLREIISKLFLTGDLNVRLTINQTLSRFTQKSVADESWKESIISCIGKNILEDTKEYAVNCKISNGDHSYEFNFIAKGNEIMYNCWKDLVDCDAFRIDITSSFKSKKLSWIIARER